MKISVIIPVYNRAYLAKKAVISVLVQTYQAYEVIVVDDGSTDGLKEELSQITDDRLTVLSQENKGVSAARNLGIRRSGGDWIAFLDSDDYWLKDKLAVQVKFHKENSAILISQTDEIWIRNGIRINPKKYHRKCEGDIFIPCLNRCMITPSAVLINRKLFNETGLFDEELLACEDYDLWLRITCKHKVGLVPKKLVVKTGGHIDQLSQKYWGMDRFRVFSLEKLLKNTKLTATQKKAVKQKLEEKLTILRNGALKRGKKFVKS